MPACIQIFANCSQVKDSDCAISFSWCGKIKSLPPPCISKFFPRYLILIAEHSMCHPGLPFPHGLSQFGGSSENFHNAKSRGLSFASSTSILAPLSRSSVFFFDNFP